MQSRLRRSFSSVSEILRRNVSVTKLLRHFELFAFYWVPLNLHSIVSFDFSPMEIVFFLSKSRLKVPRPHKKRLKLILKKKNHRNKQVYHTRLVPKLPARLIEKERKWPTLFKIFFYIFLARNAFFVMIISLLFLCWLKIACSILCRH